MDLHSLLGFFATISILAMLNAFVDFYIIYEGGKINHRLEAVIRFILICLISMCDVVLLFHGLCIFWIVFEVCLNLFRQKHWMYVGYTAETDKLIRRVFKNKPEMALLMIKSVLLITSLILIFKT